MPVDASEAAPVRPGRMTHEPLPPIPTPDPPDGEKASTEYSRYRTGLSHHRTDLSEHRTDLSEFRTDLSTRRTSMSMRRTGMSFHRTRMSADRTLMSVIRTSLSLIGFGFTIYQAFEKMREAGVIRHAAAPRNFGAILIVLGVLLLIGGLAQEVAFDRGLRRTRQEMTAGGLVYGESAFPRSIPIVVAVILLLVGLAAVGGIVFDVSLFG